jgi:hypothetical protein
MNRASEDRPIVIVTAPRREGRTAACRDLQGAGAHGQSDSRAALLNEVGSEITYRVASSLVCSASYLMTLTRLSRMCGKYGRGEGY